MNVVNDTEVRRGYGLNFRVKCEDLDESFKCMAACKSIGYKVFRMDIHCKCYCHNLPSTTMLPFFFYRTNGTTKRRHSTRSPYLFEIAVPPRAFFDATTTPEPTTTPPPQKCIVPGGTGAGGGAGGGGGGAAGTGGGGGGSDAPAAPTEPPGE